MTYFVRKQTTQLHRSRASQKPDEFPNSHTDFVKRRTNFWVASLGGVFSPTHLVKICERQIFPQVPTGGEKTLTTSCGDVGIRMESTQLTLSTMETSLLQLVDDETLFLRIAFGWLEVDLEEFFWKHEMRWSQGSCWCILATQSAFPVPFFFYINIPSGSFLGTNSSITWGPLTTYIQMIQNRKSKFSTHLHLEKKARRFLEIFEKSEKYWNMLETCEFSHPRRWILKGFMHSELYVGWMLKPITFLHIARPSPEISYSNWNNAGGFLIRCDQVTLAKSSDLEGFLLFVWSSLG